MGEPREHGVVHGVVSMEADNPSVDDDLVWLTGSRFSLMVRSVAQEVHDGGTRYKLALSIAAALPPAALRRELARLNIPCPLAAAAAAAAAASASAVRASQRAIPADAAVVSRGSSLRPTAARPRAKLFTPTRRSKPWLLPT
jgi:hypothetical protein